jgi:hypothetical protein
LAFGCGSKIPGGSNLPNKPDVPGGGNVPGGLGGASGEVDPNTCGNYAASDAGAKLKAFLTSLKGLEHTSLETIKVVRTSCVMMGHELGMTDADFPEGMEAKDVCAKVWGAIHDNMKVAVKAKGAFHFKYTPAVCKVDVNAEAEVAAKCEGKASADMGATCSGTCHGKCDGQCSGKAGTGGNSGECSGQCGGTCHGSCEGHADVKASGQCKAHAKAEANANIQCTDAKLEAKLDAKLVVDKSKAEMTLKALEKGIPQLLSVKARLEPLADAVETTVNAAKELKDMGPKFVNSFKDQALCITGQLAAAVDMASKIQVNVNVSVSVSAEASGSVGG